MRLYRHCHYFPHRISILETLFFISTEITPNRLFHVQFNAISLSLFPRKRGNCKAMDLLPHGPPVDKSSFTTTYDATFYRDCRSFAAAAVTEGTSGYAVNRSATSKAVDTVSHQSVSHSVHHSWGAGGSGANAVRQLQSEPCDFTAHLRNQPHVARLLSTEPPGPTLSTAMDAYSRERLLMHRPSSSARHLYGGSAAMGVLNGTGHGPLEEKEVLHRRCASAPRFASSSRDCG